MWNNAFWKVFGDIFQHKRLVFSGLLCAVFAAATFPAGLSMLVPVFKLMLGDGQSLPGFIEQHLIQPDRALWVQDCGRWLVGVVPEDRFNGFVSILVATIVLGLVGSVLRYLQNIFLITAIERVIRVWRDRLFARLVHSPMADLADGYTDRMSRVMGDVESLAAGYQVVLVRSVLDLLKGLGCLVAALIMDWQLTLMAMFGAPLIVIIIQRIGKTIRRRTRRSLQYSARLLSVMKESLGASSVVKSHNGEGYERRRFHDLNRRMYHEKLAMRKAKAIQAPAVEFLAHLGLTLVACVVAWRVFHQNVPPEILLGVLGMLVAGGNSLRPLSSLNVSLNAAGGAAERVLELYALPVEPVGRFATEKKPELAPHRESIRFESIRFQYPRSDREVLRGIDLDVRFGETIAIVGANGSGKSTLLNLLPRLYEPTAGRVLIDGVDIQGVGLRSLREQIGVVTQSSILFQGTIARNIAYGRSQATMTQIVDAARAAHAEDFITQLPDGYEARLAEDGLGLSGGQRQRLCIARAILRDPAILILDEATSQIDSESESIIQEALDRFRSGRTVFIIAHRFATVVGADRIVVMRDGLIEAVGTHQSLRKTCATYEQLCQKQLAGVANSGG